MNLLIYLHVPQLLNSKLLKPDKCISLKRLVRRSLRTLRIIKFSHIRVLVSYYNFNDFRSFNISSISKIVHNVASIKERP